MAGRFHYRDGRWTYYSLKPRPKAIPSHYLLYEILQLDALYRLARDPFYREEASFRRRAMATQYQPVWREETGQLLFSRLGGPEPYKRDIYDPELVCLDANSDPLSRKFFSLADGSMFLDTAFYRVKTFSTRPASCTLVVYEHKFHSEITLAAFPGFVALADWSPPVPLAYSIKRTMFDAVPGTNDTVDILPSRFTIQEQPTHYYNSQGRIYLQFNHPVTADQFAMLALALDQYTEPQRLNIAFDLSEGTGLTSYRDYRILCPHRQYLLLIPTVGGIGPEAVTRITEISVILRTSELEKEGVEKVTLHPGSMFAFRRWSDFVEYAASQTEALEYLNNPLDACR